MGGGNKLLRLLKGKPILIWAVEVFQQLPLVQCIIVSAPVGQEDHYRQLFRQYCLDKVRLVVTGGAERQDSIYKALQVIRSYNCRCVAVHDGARPLVKGWLVTMLYATLCNLTQMSEGERRLIRDGLTAEQWQNLLNIFSINEADLHNVEDWHERVVYGREGAPLNVSQTVGVIPGVPVKDTIKRLSDNGFVAETPSRSQLVAIQTPQLFLCDELLQAYDKAMEEGFIGTDDSVLVEHCGGQVKVMPGDYHNIKVTTVEDLVSAETFLEEVLNDA